MLYASTPLLTKTVILPLPSTVGNYPPFLTKSVVLTVVLYVVTFFSQPVIVSLALYVYLLPFDKVCHLTPSTVYIYSLLTKSVILPLVRYIFTPF